MTPEQMDPFIRETIAAYENIRHMSSLRVVNAHERREHKAAIYELKTGIKWESGDMTDPMPNRPNP